MLAVLLAWSWLAALGELDGEVQRRLKGWGWPESWAPTMPAQSCCPAGGPARSESPHTQHTLEVLLCTRASCAGVDGTHSSVEIQATCMISGRQETCSETWLCHSPRAVLERRRFFCFNHRALFPDPASGSFGKCSAIVLFPGRHSSPSGRDCRRQSRGIPLPVCEGPPKTCCPCLLLGRSPSSTEA